MRREERECPSIDSMVLWRWLLRVVLQASSFDTFGVPRAAGWSSDQGWGARQRGLAPQQPHLCAARQARIAFVPSAGTRLLGDYVVVCCGNEAARAQCHLWGDF